MILEMLEALLKVGLPMGLASYALVWWGLKKDYLGSVVSMQDYEKEVKRLARDKESKKHRDPVHNKWLAFGGGFYGLVALLTYVLVELGEIRDFLGQFESFRALISDLSIDLVIDLLIDSVMNFVVAISWPVYWMSEIRGKQIWIWLAAAYGGYWAGARYALSRLIRAEEAD